MIATIPKPDPWAFQSEYKQRVSDYFKANPAGTYDHFLDNWRRAHQVSRGIFDEVYVKLQKSGCIRIIEGGKAHEQLIKEIEDKIRKEKSPAEAAPAPAPEPVASPTPEPTPSKETKTMSKVYKLGDLDTEERKLMDTILQKKPTTSYDDLCTQLGFILDKAAWYPIARAMKEGTYAYPGINGFKPKGGSMKPATTPTVRASIPHPSVGSVVPFVNFTKLSSIQIIGQIDTEGWTKEEIKCFRARLPTALTEILHKSMQFKLVQYTEDDFDAGKEKVTLEVRRIL